MEQLDIDDKEQSVLLKPENILPVDSLKNLRANKLDTRAYGSCAKPVPGECLGCPAFSRCRRPGKGEERPVYGGVRIVKSQAKGGGVREVIMPCFAYWQRKAAEAATGSIWLWVAEEGEEIVVKESKPRLTIQDPEYPNDPDRRIAAPNNIGYIDVIERRIVPEFVGVNGNTRLLDAAYRSEVFKRHAEEQAQDIHDKAMRGAMMARVPGVPAEAQKPERRKKKDEAPTDAADDKPQS